MADDATPATPAEETKDAPAAPAEEVKKEEAPAKAEKEEKKEEKIEQTVELSKDAQKILDAVSELKVLDLANLVKAMEEKFGVSAAAPVAAAAAPAAGGGEAAEEKSSFSVELTAAGDNKIGAIKAVKAITGEGLGEAKATVEGAPKVIKENVPKEEAEKMKKDLEEAGCTVALKYE
jgi:large subunit ribosomal protein L7/L12